MPGHSYKGSAARGYTTTAINAPAAYTPSAGVFNWVWTPSNPAQWSMETFDGTNWNQVATNGPTVRTDSGSFGSGDIASVIGQDANGNNVTARSNVIVFS